VSGHPSESVVDTLEQILRSTGRYLFLRKVKPTSEPILQREMFPVLKSAFPSLAKDWSIPHVAKTYKVDFAIPDLNALIEFKFCNSKHDWPRMLDEVFADIKGYAAAGPEWRHLYFVFYLTERYTTPEEVAAEFLASECGAWKPIVVYGAAEPDKSAG